MEEIVSGGAVGVDFCAAEYAKKKGLRLTEFLPQYGRYGRAAPIVRNKKIVDYADKIIVFWDGSSKEHCQLSNMPKKSANPLKLYFASEFCP